MKIFDPFFRALSFLTRLPVPSWIHRDDPTRDPVRFHRGWIPVVGGVLGFFLALSALFIGELKKLGPSFSPFLSAFLILVVWIVLTGALHLDGVADTVECAMAEVPLAEKKRIRKDPRKGVFAVVALVLAILAKWIGIVNAVPIAAVLFLSPLLSRSALVPLFLLLSPAGKGEGEGLGSLLLDRGTKEKPFPGSIGPWAGLALVITLVFVMCGKRGLAGVAVSEAGTFLLGFWFLRRIDGLSGDLAGFLIESGEILFLLSMSL